jgi:putative transposase
MGRARRPLEAGLTYHVTARGVIRSTLCFDEEDYLDLSGEVAAATAATGCRIGTSCIMPNHIHLLVTTPQPNLDAFMHRVAGRYAKRFNARYEREGHAFDRRYRARVVGCDDYLRTVARYIALNPVRARLCADPLEYRWSGHRALLGLEVPPAFLDPAIVLGAFDSDLQAARAAYSAFVAAGDVDSTARPSLASLVRRPAPAAVAAAVERYGYSAAEIARHLNLHRSTVTRMLRRSP